jgi:hypothetical protein
MAINSLQNVLLILQLVIHGILLELIVFFGVPVVESDLRSNQDQLARFLIFPIFDRRWDQIAVFGDDTCFFLEVFVDLILLDLVEEVTDNCNEKVKHDYHHKYTAEKA